MSWNQRKTEIQAELERAYRRIAELESAAAGRADATECKQVELALRESEKRLRSMLEISQAMSASLEMSVVLQKIVENAVGLLKLDSGAIYTLKGDELFLEATTPPLPPEFPDELRHANVADHPHIQAALASGSTVILPDTAAAALSSAEQTVAESRGLRSIAYVPLMISEKAIGVLIVASVNRLRTFGDEEIALYAGFSGQAAQTIENARLYQSERAHAAELEAQVAERNQVEQALRRSEAKWRSLFETCPVGIALADTQGNIVDINPAFLRQLGYTHDEIVTKHYEDFTPLEWRAQEAQNVAQLKTTGLPMYFEKEHIRKDGTVYPVALTGWTIRNECGAPGILGVFVQDISERKAADVALRASETKYRLLVDASIEGIWSMDREHRTTYVNQSMADMLGYEPSEMLGKKVEEFFFAEDTEFHQARMEERHRGQDEIYERRFRRRDGSPLWTLVSARVQKDAEGSFDGSFAMFTDITSRKQAEEILANTERRYRALIENAPDGIVLVELGGKITYASPSVTRLFGYTQEEALASDPNELTHPEELPMVLTELAALIEDPTHIPTLQYRFLHKNGEWRWIESTFSNLLTLPSVEGIVINFRDIHARKLAEEALKKSQALLTEAQRIGRIGHIEWNDGEQSLIFSDEVFAILGVPHGTAITQQTIAGMMAPEERARIQELDMQAIQQRSDMNYEYVVRLRDGSERWIHQLGRMTYDDNGVPIRMMAIIQDVTERKQAEEALRAGEERFRTVADFTYDLEYWLDENRQLQYISPSCARLTGYRRDEFMPNPALLETIVHPEDRPLYHQHLAEEFDMPAHGSIDFRIVTAGGLERWVTHTCQGVYTADGKPRGRRVSVRDITERRHAVEELRASEARYRLLSEELEARVRQRTAEVQDLYENAPTGYHSLDANGNFVMVNQTELNWLGYTREEMVGRAAGDFMTEASRGVFGEYFARFRQRGWLKDIELDLVRRDGTILPVSLNATAIRDEAGNFVMSRSTLFDITERKRAENELKRNANFTRALLNSIPTPVFYKDSEGRYLGCNRAFAELMGKTSEEIMGKLPHQVWPTALADVYRQKDIDLMQSQEIQIYESTICDKDGNTRPVIFVKNAFLDESGKSAGLVGAFIDITERKRAEETLLQANMALERAMRMKDEFLATMSHELRTPLTGILGLSEALQLEVYGGLNVRQMKTVNSIENSGRHLLALINDVLDLSKVEAGKLELEIAPCALEEICRASLQLTKGMAHQKHQQVNYAASIDAVFLDVDARRIKQVLVNLLSNAIKFTPENGELGLVVEHDQTNRQVTLIVWDKGIGIKPENLSRLFQPFTQIDGSLAREYSGTGLGLALVRRLVELHNGSVAVESVFGEGSRFIVTLPWTPQTVQVGSPEAGGEESYPATVDEIRSAPIILITDDNQILLDMLTDFLGSQKYRTARAHSGKELLEKIEAIKPDVILMDIQMPGMDGLETIRRVRNHRDAAIAATPIIAVTAIVMPGDREHCLAAGANEYLSKPLNLKHLAAVIQDLAPGVACPPPRPVSACNALR
jgi:PAS domain S-box-containing protein